MRDKVVLDLLPYLSKPVGKLVELRKQERVILFF